MGAEQEEQAAAGASRVIFCRRDLQDRLSSPRVGEQLEPVVLWRGRNRQGGHLPLKQSGSRSLNCAPAPLAGHC